MKNFHELFVVVWMLFGILLTPLLFIGFDFWAGVRKAKQRNERMTSKGWRRTIDKIARYYNMLLALVVIDCMQMSGVWYLDNFYDYHIPIFPFVTMAGAMSVAIVEMKSILEKAEDKTKKQIADITELVGEIVKQKMTPVEIAAVIIQYINERKEKQNG